MTRYGTDTGGPRARRSRTSKYELSDHRACMREAERRRGGNAENKEKGNMHKEVKREKGGIHGENKKRKRREEGITRIWTERRTHTTYHTQPPVDPTTALRNPHE